MSEKQRAGRIPDFIIILLSHSCPFLAAVQEQCSHTLEKSPGLGNINQLKFEPGKELRVSGSYEFFYVPQSCNQLSVAAGRPLLSIAI